MERSAFILILLVLCLAQLGKSDISNDECGILSKQDLEKIANEISEDNAVPEPKAPKIDYEGRPRPDQKSLLIIFDATGSMATDLVQMKASAQEIIVELSEHEENPIYNFVLSVFRDPGTFLFLRENQE